MVPADEDQVTGDGEAVVREDDLLEDATADHEDRVDADDVDPTQTDADGAREYADMVRDESAAVDHNDVAGREVPGDAEVPGPAPVGAERAEVAEDGYAASRLYEALAVVHDVATGKATRESAREWLALRHPLFEEAAREREQEKAGK
jgi:hypothetical protein